MKILCFAIAAIVATLSVHAGRATITCTYDGLKNGDTAAVYTDKYGYPWFMGFDARYPGLIRDHSFSISIPVGQRPLKIENFVFSLHGRMQFQNLFLEDGDSIQITTQNGRWMFSGRGSAKWAVYIVLDSIYLDAIHTVRWEDPADARRYFELVDSAVLRQAAYLQRHTAGLSGNALTILRANILGLFNVKSGFLNGFDSARLRVAIHYLAGYHCGINAGMLNSLRPVPSNPVLLSAQTFCNGLLQAYRLDSCMAVCRPYLLDRFYAFAKKHLPGVERERAVMNAIYLERNTATDIAPFVEDALDWVENKDFRQVLRSLQQGRVAGAAAFAFRLPDDKGIMRTQASLQGKVVLLDFWYTGCGNCLRAHPFIDSIKMLFKGQPFAVVTVNIDKDRNWWIKSLKEGKYCGRDDMNVYTEGLGEEHPMLRYYWVNSFPTFILVDKQGRLMKNPLDPRNDNGRDMVSLIRQGLGL